MLKIIKLAAIAAVLLLPASVFAVGNPVVSIVAPASASSGDSVSVDVVIDSDDLMLAGYSFSVRFSVGGSAVGVISNPSVVTTGLVPASIENVFGTRQLCPGGAGCGADDGFFNLNQSSFAGEAAPGIYTVETLSFTVDAANGSLLLIEPFFQLGDSLGIAGGACPPGVGAASCQVTFQSATVQIGVPEPVLAVLFGGAALGLLAVRRRS